MNKRNNSLDDDIDDHNIITFYLVREHSYAY